MSQRALISVIGVLVVLAAFLLYPSAASHSLGGSRERDLMLNASLIGKALTKYADDHAGKFPAGKSSTEVFQQILDQHYISDPGVFYCPMAGKTRAQDNELKPANVCWDTTCCMDADSPADLPILFLTGFKINYQPGGSAELLDKSGWGSMHNWIDVLSLRGGPIQKNGIVVYYKNQNTYWKMPDSNGDIPDCISSAFGAGEKIYKQLTPDGALSK